MPFSPTLSLFLLMSLSLHLSLSLSMEFLPGDAPKYFLYYV
jgi:hypothetical protein